MRVFTFEQLEHHEVPELQAFSEVAKFARDTLSAPIEVYGALELGSLALGNVSITSDVDVLVVSECIEQGEWRCEVALHKIDEFARERHVPFGGVFIPWWCAYSGDHSISPSFRRHLEGCSARYGFIKRDPLSAIRMDRQLSLQRDIHQFLVRKFNEVQKEVSHFPLPSGKLEQFCAKLLGIARPVCLKMSYLDGWECVEGEGENVIASYQEWCTSMKAKVALRILLEKKEEYQQVVEKQLKSPEPHSYTALLHRIQNGTSKTARTFLRENLELMHRYSFD